jgi:uncharacterized FAD-dependent dehydrogenase
MGGGNFVVPVQTVTDFLENRLSGRFKISLTQVVLLSSIHRAYFDYFCQ